jgi:hypothetical protein
MTCIGALNRQTAHRAVSENSIDLSWAILKGPCTPTESEMYPSSASVNSPLDSPPAVPTGM